MNDGIRQNSPFSGVITRVVLFSPVLGQPQLARKPLTAVCDRLTAPGPSLLTTSCPAPGLLPIQQAAERPERNFVDSRQLKVCATCFDLSVSLLRVLEMTITLVPEIFLNWSRPSAELLLRRLAQVHFKPKDTLSVKINVATVFTWCIDPDVPKGGNKKITQWHHAAIKPLENK
eukprot:g43432.t1